VTARGYRMVAVFGLLLFLLGPSSQALAKPRTAITGMKAKLRGYNPGEDYYLEAAVRVRVCGARGRVLFHVNETLSPYGRDTPVGARTRRSVVRDQDSRCQTHRFTFEVADKFFGISRYRIAVRAKTTGRAFSGLRDRHFDTGD